MERKQVVELMREHRGLSVATALVVLAAGAILAWPTPAPRTVGVAVSPGQVEPGLLRSRVAGLLHNG